MTVPVEELVAEAHAALRAGDAAGARALLEQAGAEPASGDVIDGLAHAAYLELDLTGAIESWERAYAAYRDAGDRANAMRVARTLGFMHGTVIGDRAVMSGWLARARTLLGDATDSVEGGWVSLDTARFDGDAVRKEALFRVAVELARRFGDADLEFVALSYLGASLVLADRIEEGMGLLDEALAAVAGSEVEQFLSLQDIFCQLFAACEHAHDVTRAEQWMRVGEAISERRKLPTVSAFCRTHYGGILTAAGRWPEADVALTEAVRLWGLGHRSLQGGALVRLAELRVRQGRFEEAEQLLEGLDVNIAAARPLAAIHLARGQTARAGDILERALAQVDPQSTAAAPLLAMLVDVHLSASRLDAAEEAAELLATCAARHDNHYVKAAAALARGRVCLAAGTGDPQACLRDALAGFSARGTADGGRARPSGACERAPHRPSRGCHRRGARRPRGIRTARRGSRTPTAAAAVLRTLGVRATPAGKGVGPLTRREAEVLELLGHGLSNPRSPTASTSAGRPSSTTSATSSESSVCVPGARPPRTRSARNQARDRATSPMRPRSVRLRVKAQPNREDDHDRGLRRHRRRRTLRRRTDRHAAGPQGLPRTAARPGLVPERHALDARHPRARRRGTAALGAARRGHRRGLPAGRHLFVRLRADHDHGHAATP